MDMPVQPKEKVTLKQQRNSANVQTFKLSGMPRETSENKSKVVVEFFPLPAPTKEDKVMVQRPCELLTMHWQLITELIQQGTPI